MQASHHFANQADFVSKTESDLKQGLTSHNLQTFISDINDMRAQVPAGQFSSWMQALNNSTSDLYMLPLDTTIVGLDKTGKNVVVANDKTQTAGVFSPAGEQLSKMTEQQATGAVDQHMAKVSDLTKGDGKFSILMPPGLDTTGIGKFKINNYKDNVTKNADGSIAHSVTGSLDDATSRWNLHGQVSATAAQFSGSYTTTADGNLLNSKITYNSDYKQTTILGGMENQFPNVDFNPTAPYRELGGATLAQSLETYYSSAKGEYVTKFSELNDANNNAKVLETTASGGGTQTKQLARQESIGDTDSTSNATTITRDKNLPVEVKDRSGNDWKKVSANQWSETSSMGQKSTFTGKVLVGNNGDITFRSAEQTIIEPASGTLQYVLNSQGRLIAATEDPDLTYKYTYSKDGKQVTETSTQIYGGTTTITNNQEPSDYYQDLLPPINFF